MTQTLHIGGMTCGSCVKHVNEALLSIPGISQSSVDLASHTATITTDNEVSRDVLFERLEKSGYVLQ